MSAETNKPAKATQKKQQLSPLEESFEGTFGLHHNCVTVWNLQRER